MNSRRIKWFCALLPLLLLAPLASSQTLVLQRTFIEQYKDRATIDGKFIVDHAHKRANPGKKDGDLHAAGRSNEVGLPMVAEVMNAAGDSQVDVVDAIHANEGKGNATPISGAWRIWFEHPSKLPQIQFHDVPPAANTNPAHCFEIHPITMYAGKPIPDSLREIPDFTPKDAESAFGRYEKLSANLEIGDQTVTITSKMVGFNYVGFVAQLAGKRESLDKNDAGAIDGEVVLANVMDNEGDTVLVNDVRLIFIAGTPPAEALANAGDGATLELLGIPRLDLNAISAFIAGGGSGSYVRKLPYEMIVVAVKRVDGAPVQPATSTRKRSHS